MAKASTHTAWGPIFTEAELNEMPQPLRSPLFACAWDAALGNHAAASPILPATAMFAPSGLRLPRFLSWILPFRYAFDTARMNRWLDLLVRCLHDSLVQIEAISQLERKNRG